MYIHIYTYMYIYAYALFDVRSFFRARMVYLSPAFLSPFFLACSLLPASARCLSDSFSPRVSSFIFLSSCLSSLFSLLFSLFRFFSSWWEHKSVVMMSGTLSCVLQCVAVCCSVLQYVAVCCNAAVCHHLSAAAQETVDDAAPLFHTPLSLF